MRVVRSGITTVRRVWEVRQSRSGQIGSAQAGEAGPGLAICVNRPQAPLATCLAAAWCRLPGRSPVIQVIPVAPDLYGCLCRHWDFHPRQSEAQFLGHAAAVVDVGAEEVAEPPH